MPNIVFRADYDALPMDEVIDLPWGSKFPGKAHKCGHDGHSATLAGFALEVDQFGANQNIFFLFQPAEETGDGAIQCVELIKEEAIDEIFGLHNLSEFPFKSVATKDGTVHCASKGMSIYFEGSPAHASQPEDGANPSLAISKVIQALAEFTSEENNEGLILATVVQVDIGEEAFGISAYKGTLRLTIRALYEEELDRLQQNIEQLSHKLAEEDNFSVRFEYRDEFPETANDAESAEKVRQAAKNLGAEYTEVEKAFRGSEDYGHYTKLTKGAYFYVGNGKDYPQVHTNEYDYRDENIEVGVNMYKEIIALDN